MRRLKEARKAAGLTMKELGDRVGVTEAAISLYESGRREPSQSVLVAISEILGCSTDYLLERERKPVDMTDFTYAMHGAERDLTDHDKEMLLQMAQRLAEANRGKR